MSDCADLAVKAFANGYNCCQSVLLSGIGPCGLDGDLAARLATGFGVGLSRGGVCGAVSGAVMLLGLAHGGGGPAGASAKAATYALVREFQARFVARHGSLRCRDLIGLDPSTPEGLDRARQENRFATICLDIVGDAARLVETILAARP